MVEVLQVRGFRSAAGLRQEVHQKYFFEQRRAVSHFSIGHEVLTVHWPPMILRLRLWSLVPTKSHQILSLSFRLALPWVLISFFSSFGVLPRQLSYVVSKR